MSFFLLGVGLSITLSSCSISSKARAENSRVELTFVSYAVTKAAYENIIPQFSEKWRQEFNQEVVFYEAYGGSGAQTRAVVDGLDADVVNLALALDTKKIEKAGLIEPGWEKEAPNQSIVHKSVGVIVTREGNPKDINSWEDLTKPGVNVVTANPKTSGGARWNFLALWGSVAKTDGKESQALDFVSKVYKNAPVLPRDAREASDVFFKQGQGDALINYENEVIIAKQNGLKMPYFVPDVNISIDSPITVVDKNVDKHGTRKVAEAFVEYLFSPEAQREFAKVGFRPVNDTVAKEFADKYPPVKTLFTVQDLGGWDAVQKDFFADGAAFDKIQSRGK
ncbi:MAG: sulfate ABC transporter substrate-binding protein [Coleofasciculaceae cyanobacterium]